MKLTLNKKWFNPLYFIVNDLMKDPTIRTFFIYGGKSSSKTYTIAQIQQKNMVAKGRSSLAFRKESTTIDTTLKRSFSSAIDGMYLNPVVTKMDRKYKCTNEAEIVLKGIDDEEKAKGVEGFYDVLLDELNTFNQGEYDAFEMSLRGLENQHIFGTWNPIDENNWVKVDLIDKIEWVETNYKLPCENSFVRRSKCGMFVLIKTTYEDNFWISGSKGKSYTVNGETTTIDEEYGFVDVNLIAKYNAMKERNYNRYKVEVLGEWGKTIFGGEFLKEWKSEKHAGIKEYNPKLAIHLIFDENSNPYFPCGIFQVNKEETEAYLIDCIALKNPDNTTSAMCREITRKLRLWGHNEAVYIGGDATSKKQDVKQEKGHDLFYLIMSELKEFSPRRAVLNSNPSVRVSADFMNDILAGNIEDLSFLVDKKCGVAIKDYEYTKEDKNGGVDKKTVTDPITKVSYQPYGHFVDLTRYFFCYTFMDKYIRYQRKGESSHVSTGKNISKHQF